MTPTETPVFLTVHFYNKLFTQEKQRCILTGRHTYPFGEVHKIVVSQRKKPGGRQGLSSGKYNVQNFMLFFVVPHRKQQVCVHLRRAYLWLKGHCYPTGLAKTLSTKSRESISSKNSQNAAPAPAPLPRTS